MLVDRALDGFLDAMQQILGEAQENAELLHNAPSTLPVTRLDEVRAARELNLGWTAKTANGS